MFDSQKGGAETLASHGYLWSGRRQKCLSLGTPRDRPGPQDYATGCSVCNDEIYKRIDDG